ncbi:MAG: HlyD family type I secretion periplasmic adaptor subunit [Alphaproteobacteria bacterium]
MSETFTLTRALRKILPIMAAITFLVDRASAKLVPPHAQGSESPDALARPVILRGMWVLVLLFGVIGAWAAFWPLATGAIAPGRVVADSNRKEIQHLEGGIIKEILVKEGQQVAAGEMLARLESANAEARQGLLRGQLIAAQATQARLIAERDGAASITFPPSLTKLTATDPEIAQNIDAQTRLFNSRRESLGGQINVLNQKIRQSEEEIKGYEKQSAAASRQVALLNEEITTVRMLVAKGNAVKPRLLALERQAAELEGQRGQTQALAARATQTINEAKITILNTRSDFLNKVLAELKDVQLQLSGLEEQTGASEDVMRRIDIKSPIAGTVTGLMIHTIGGILKPGATMMSIVPSDDKLIIEARVNPQDIDVVHAGLTARVRLSAYSARYVPPVEGKVMTISADRFDDAAMGSYFLARIEIPPAQLAALNNVKLSAGMPAEVLIVTGSRSMLSYLTQPITQSFGRAFREQ